MQKTPDATRVLAAGLRANQVKKQINKTPQKLKKTPKPKKTKPTKQKPEKLHSPKERHLFLSDTLTNIEETLRKGFGNSSRNFFKTTQRRKNAHKEKPDFHFVIQTFTFISLSVKRYATSHTSPIRLPK